MKPSFDTENSDESEWIRRCQKGDRDAFAALVDRYKAWIHRHLYAWSRRGEVAEEMTQEVFLRVFSRIRKFRGDAKFSTWLFQIALNLARDHWRSAERRNTDLKELAENEVPDSAVPGADGRFEEAERNRRLFLALQSLPEIYRETLMLRYFSDLSLDEICQIQNQGLSNVKMRIARGLGHLRKKLEEKHYET